MFYLVESKAFHAPPELNSDYCVVPSPGGGCDPIDHEVDGLSGPQLDALSQHMHELGNWRRLRTTKHSKKISYGVSKDNPSVNYSSVLGL